jgi:hypothetical protein
VDDQYRDLAAAREIRCGKLRDLRPIVEAYILSGADDESVARAVAVTPQTIAAFRQSFYDVERFRGSHAYVLRHLIGIGGDESDSLDEPRFLKLIGFRLGPSALDQMLGGGENELACFKRDGLAAWSTQHAEVVIAIKRLFAVYSASANDPRQVTALMTLRRKISANEQDEMSIRERALTSGIETMLSEMPWTHGAVAKKVFEGTLIGKLDEGAIELRDDELLLAGLGQTPEFFKHLAEELPPIPLQTTPPPGAIQSDTPPSGLPPAEGTS